MANYKNNKKSVGLKGGPNEYITHISDLFSVEGYKANSPDVNNPYNIINSGNITMEGVDFPVIGTDNLGNRKLMTPGNNYQFPGDQVYEVPMAQGGFELNQTSANPFVYGDWAEKSRSVNPATGATTIIDERTGNRDVAYSKRGVNWKVGYDNWLAAGNEGSLTDFKIEAERWKKSQTKNESDIQNRERTEPGDEASITGDFYGSGIGNTTVPNGPGGPNEPGAPDGPNGPGGPSEGFYGNVGVQGNTGTTSTGSTTIQPLIPRPIALIDQPEIPFSSRYPGGSISPRGEVLPDAHVNSTSSYEVNSKKKNNGNEKLKQTFLEDTTVTDEDGYSNMNIKSVNNGNRERLKQVFQIYNPEGDLLAKQVDKTGLLGNPVTRFRVTDEGEAAGYGQKNGGGIPKGQRGFEIAQDARMRNDIQTGQNSGADMGAGLWEAITSGAGTVADYYTELKKLAGANPITKQIFNTIDPVTKISHALDLLSIPGSLIAETVEGVGGQGDGQFNITDAIPDMSGDFSFTNINNEPVKNVAGVAGVENPVGAFALNLFTDPSTYVGAGLAKNVIKKGIRTGAKSIDNVASKFTSDINWGNWHKSIPENKILLQEYQLIEETTKANGTWMKNADGSPFIGRPEQFVQQKSGNFQKAFPNSLLDDAGNPLINYHGSGSKFDAFDGSKFYSGEYGKGVYTSPDKEAIIKSYANPAKKRTQKMAGKSGADSPTPNLYELYINSKNPRTTDDILNWRNWGKRIDELPSLADWKTSDFGKKILNSEKYLKTDDDIISFIRTNTPNNPIKESYIDEGGDFLRAINTPLQEGVTPFWNQMKSAVGNDGMFDITNPNIYQKYGGEQLPKAQDAGETGSWFSGDQGYIPDSWEQPIKDATSVGLGVVKGMGSLALDYLKATSRKYPVEVIQYPIGYKDMPPGHIEARLLDTENLPDKYADQKTYVNRWVDSGNESVTYNHDTDYEDGVRTAILNLTSKELKRFMKTAQTFTPGDTTDLPLDLNLPTAPGGALTDYDLANSNCADGVCDALGLDGDYKTVGITTPYQVMEGVLGHDGLQSNTGKKKTIESIAQGVLNPIDTYMQTMSHLTGLEDYRKQNGGSLPQAQVGKGLDYVSGLDGNVIMHEDEALQNINQKNLDSAKDFAGKWMNSPRYLEMLNNSGGSEWWNRAGDVQSGRISNFNKLQDAPLYISNDPNPYYSEKALNGIAGYSQTDTGKIYVKPKSGGRATTNWTTNTLYDHEISHSIDRPTDKFLLTDIAQFYARGMNDGGRLIPDNDIELMGNLIDPTLDVGKTVSFWESFGDTPEEGTRNYYSNPTEVRARLNEIRKDMNVNGFDVFNKEITYDDMPTSRVKAFRDLKRLYSEDSILQMLNTISDTGTLPDADTLPAAQEGVEVGPKEWFITPEGYKWNGNSLVPNDWSEFHDEVDDTSILDFNNMLAYVSESRGGTEEFWGNTADTIAFHESGAQQRMDGLAKQISQNEDGSLFDGPGRGVFQFEGPSLETAQTRYKNIARARGFTLDPEIIKATSADLLPMDKQYTLFFANLIESDAKLSDYPDGKMEQVDLWLQGHKNIEKPGDRASFQESVGEAKKKGITGGHKSFEKKQYGGGSYDGGYESGNSPYENPFSYGTPVDTDVTTPIAEEEVDITQLPPLDINLLQPPIISIRDEINVNQPVIRDQHGRDINDLSPEDLDIFYEELDWDSEQAQIQRQRDQELIDQEYIDPNQVAGFVTNANQRGQDYERGFEDFTERSLEDVKLMQGDLLERGYDIGPTRVDGIYGRRTHEAYSSMIADAGLEESAISRYDKKYNPETYTEVKAIQTKLIEKGFLSEITEAGKSNIDGRFGERTKMALLDYNSSKVEEEEDVEGLIFDTIPTTLEDDRCAAGMCEILELNDVETEAIGVKYKDAWDLLESMEHVGNSVVQFNIYDDSLFDNVDENTSVSELKNLTAKAKRKYQTTASNYKVGDIVGIYWPGSSHHDETLNSETHNTHSGFVSSIDENGTPIITHNVGGNVRNVPYNEVATAWISRPNENIRLTTTYAEQQDLDDIAISQVDPALISNFENKIERPLTDEERTIVSNIMQRANYNSKHIPEILNSSVDQEWLNAAIFGITGVETAGGINAPRTRDDLSTTRALAHEWKDTKDADISLGIGKTKYNSLDNFARNYFEINSAADLADDNKAVDAISYIIVKNYELFKNYAQQYPALGLSEEDVRNMTLLSYNQGVSRLLTTGRNEDNTRSSDEELAALRELYEGSMADISSTNYSRVPGGESLYNAALAIGYETPSERYISKTNRYITEVYGGSEDENNRLLALNNQDNQPIQVLAKGGEYGVFKNYMNGEYNDTSRLNFAEGVFDKLNRKHYKEAKSSGMSAPNYIMSHLVG